MRVVIRIGGSIIASPPNPILIRRYAFVVKELREQKHELVVITGGGSLARELIKIAKEIGLTEAEQDEIAISVSRLFAQLLGMKIGNVNWKTIPTSLSEVSKILLIKGIVVMGGLKPGMTTDTVAALVSSEIGAQVIVKVTDQDGVYTKDPKKHINARKLDELTFEELDKILEHDAHKAGIHQIIDPEAIRLLKKKGIKTIIVNGSEPENLIVAIKGEKIGTIIK